jgi:ribonucleoside-diphosphate reductase beta chain
VIEDHPPPRLTPLLNGVEHANPIIPSLSNETRATEYSKGATRGNWGDVWATFDKRRKARANGGADEGEGDDPDMFKAAGIAAE